MIDGDETAGYNSIQTYMIKLQTFLLILSSLRTGLLVLLLVDYR